MKNVISKVKQVLLHKQAAKVSIVTEHYLEALELLKQCSKMEGENNCDTFADMAQCIWMQGNIDQMRDEGLPYLQQSLKLNGEHAASWLNRGCMEEKLGMDADAKDSFENARDFSANGSEVLRKALVNLGSLHYKKGENS